jgi:uncharacterized protein
MMGKEQLNDAIAGPGARHWVSAAARSGIASAQIRFGRMLLEGQGVTQDRTAAYEYFQRAAAQGDIEAHNMLGRCHENGWGTNVNYPAAATHYCVAAEAGLDWAQYNLGHMLLSGVGVPQDRAIAFSWYNRAAAQGHVRAMNLVGRCREQGWGTSKHISEALVWYRRSAAGGYFRGAFNLASLLSDKGCDFGAAYWFRQALGAAPEPSRTNILAIVACHGSMMVRAIADEQACQRQSFRPLASLKGMPRASAPIHVSDPELTCQNAFDAFATHQGECATSRLGFSFPRSTEAR